MALFNDIKYDGDSPFTVRVVSKGLRSATTGGAIRPGSAYSGLSGGSTLEGEGSVADADELDVDDTMEDESGVHILPPPPTCVRVVPLEESVQIAQPFIVEVQICSANGNVVKDAKAPVTLKCFKEDGTPVNLTVWSSHLIQGCPEGNLDGWLLAVCTFQPTIVDYQVPPVTFQTLLVAF